MRKLVMTILPLALAACSGGNSGGDATGGSGSQAQMPQLVLQPILFPDITQNKLYGPGCNFVPSTGGMGAVFMAQPERGVVKIDDHVVAIPLANDGASLPQGVHTHYAGPLYAATLVVEPGAKQKTVGATVTFKGHLTITDAKRQKVFEASGDTQCRPG